MQISHEVTQIHTLDTNIVGQFELKIGKQYVCWNQFKNIWYMGHNKNAEIFSVSKNGEISNRTKQVLDKYPSAIKIWHNGWLSRGRHIKIDAHGYGLLESITSFLPIKS